MKVSALDCGVLQATARLSVAEGRHRGRRLSGCDPAILQAVWLADFMEQVRRKALYVVGRKARDASAVGVLNDCVVWPQRDLALAAIADKAFGHVSREL